MASVACSTSVRLTFSNRGIIRPARSAIKACTLFDRTFARQQCTSSTKRFNRRYQSSSKRTFSSSPSMGDANESQSFPAQKASDILIGHWQKGTTLSELPADLKPSSVAQGYEIQSHIERLTSPPLWGWKIAATSIHGQQHINVDRPLAGRIMIERVTPYGEKIPLGRNRMAVAELEFAFRIGKDILPRSFGVWETQEVMDCIDGLFLGSEIPDSRYEDFTKVGAAQLIADNACADRYILGPEVKDWKDKDLIEHIVKGWIVGNAAVHEGKGGNVLGDPRIAMTWIANELSRYGVPLRKGQYVTTGTCVVPLPVKPGDKIVGDYGSLGRLEIEFE